MATIKWCVVVKQEISLCKMELPRRKRLKASEEDSASRYRHQYTLTVILYLTDPERGIETEISFQTPVDGWHTFPQDASPLRIQYAQLVQMLKQDLDSSVVDKIQDAVVFWVGNETAKAASGVRLAGAPSGAITHDEIIIQLTPAISLFVSYEVLRTSPIASLIHGIKNLFSKKPEPEAEAKMLARRAPKQTSRRWY